MDKDFIIIHFATKGQIHRMQQTFGRPPWLQLMMQFAFSDKQLQTLREGQEQKKLERIASEVFPPGFL